MSDDLKNWHSAEIFPHPIWVGHYAGDLTELRKKTLNFLENSKDLNVGLERDGGASSSSSEEMPHTWPEAQAFYEWVKVPSQHIWEHWGYTNAPLRGIEKSWASYHPKGAYTDVHTHGRADQVIVLYLDVPRDSGNLEIANPLFYHWEGTRRKRGDNGWRPIEVKTGDVVIFPGWIQNRTSKNKNDKPRTIINTNVSIL